MIIGSIIIAIIKYFNYYPNCVYYCVYLQSACACVTYEYIIIYLASLETTVYYNYYVKTDI